MLRMHLPSVLEIVKKQTEICASLGFAVPETAKVMAAAYDKCLVKMEQA